MRVLLRTNDGAPSLGGGYTLPQELYQTLISKSNGCGHEFFSMDSRSGGEEDSLTQKPVTIPFRRALIPRVTERLVYDAKRILFSHRYPYGGPMAPYWKALKTKLADYRVDCVLSLTPTQWIPVLPNIVTIWDLEHRRKPYFPELSDVEWGWSWEAREENYAAVLPKAAAVIVGTEAGKRQIERFYGVDPENIKVIPYPTPSFALEARKSKRPREEVPVHPEKEFIFYPAQYWPHKNHVRLLEALKILDQQYGWQGALVCCGSDKGNLPYVRKCAADLGLEGKVYLLGFVSRAELVALYQHALALTFVSYLGPDNLPPLEAFALGCPVIASAVEGAREALGSAALYANPDSAPEIAAAVWQLIKKRELRQELATAGTERAMQSTVDEYVDRLIELLDHLELRFKCFRK